MALAILGILIGGSLGTLFLLGFVRLIAPTLGATRTGATAQGTIVATKSERVQYRTIYRPIVQFSTPDGHHVEYRDVIAVPAGFQVGDVVTVHYDPRNPRLTATISDTGRALKLSAAAGAMTLLMAGIVAIGVLMLVRVLPLPHF